MQRSCCGGTTDESVAVFTPHVAESGGRHTVRAILLETSVRAGAAAAEPRAVAADQRRQPSQVLAQRGRLRFADLEQVADPSESGTEDDADQGRRPKLARQPRRQRARLGLSRAVFRL